jgi:hypothetical protein
MKSNRYTRVIKKLPYQCSVGLFHLEKMLVKLFGRCQRGAFHLQLFVVGGCEMPNPALYTQPKPQMII